MPYFADVDTNTSNNIGAANYAANHQSNQNCKPEWLRVPEAVRIFGFCRSSLYELIKAGAIKSVCVRKRCATRGVRLINFSSLAAHVENAARAGGAGKK
jgi:hypothetical protein